MIYFILIISNFKNIKLDSGISYIQLTLLPYIKANISIEQIFKKISASKEYPYIKYNPGKNQENLFRLYSEKKNNRGKKVPFLDKSIIFKLDKRANKSKSIIFNVNVEEKYLFYVELLSNGQLFFNFESEKSFIDYNTINELMIQNINTFLSYIEPFFGTIDHIYNNVHSLHDKYIQIMNIDYYINYKLTKKINIKRFIKCFSPIFNLLQDDINKDIKLRYKKVSNFNEMESIDAFITELLKIHKSDSDIIKELEMNFDINYEKAKHHYEYYRSQVDMEEDVGFLLKRRNIKNPGFNVIISKKQSTEFQVNISKIDNLLYLPLISMYVTNIFYVNEGLYDIKQSFLKTCDPEIEKQYEATFKDLTAKPSKTDYKVSKDQDNENDELQTNNIPSTGPDIRAFRLNNASKQKSENEPDELFGNIFSNSDSEEEEEEQEEEEEVKEEEEEQSQENQQEKPTKISEILSDLKRQKNQK